MAIINERWPEDLAPNTCVFDRLRNDVQQRSPITRRGSIIRQGRPLWGAQLTWLLPNTERLSKLNYYLEALDGFAGSVQIWDFARPFPETPLLTASLSATAGTAGIPWTYSGTHTTWFYGDGTVYFSFGGLGASIAISAGVGATSIIVGGFPAGAVAAIQGQPIQIGRRRYVVAQDTVANASGEASITILGGLFNASSAGELVRMGFAACEMQLASQDYSGSASAGDGFIRVSASFIETVEDFAA